MGHETNFSSARSGAESGRVRGSETGFVQVAQYRLYGLDGVNKVASGEWFEAEDDRAAIKVATKLMNGSGCELWSGTRLVARIPRVSKV